jgi:hypothetical protein
MTLVCRSASREGDVFPYLEARVDLRAVGDILMIVGAIGLVIWMIVWAPWARSRRSPYPPPE